MSESDTTVEYAHHRGGLRQTRLYPFTAPRYFDALWLLALAIYILAGTPITPFHADESTQIFMSRDYAYQFIQRDLNLVTFQNPPVSATEQQLRLLNGTINKYLIGLAWHLGGFSVTDINEQWDWGADWNYNEQNGHSPSSELLLVARWPSALLLAAGVAIMFALGHALGGRMTAYLASLYYALNPALLLNGHRAMMEGSMIFFSLLVVLAGIWFLRRGSLWTAILLGIASGMALASKHTAILTVAAIFGGCLVFTLLNRQDAKNTEIISEDDYTRIVGIVGTRRAVSKQFIFLFFSGLIAFGTFYALNPAWWGDPIARAGDVLAMRQELLSIQTDVFGHYPAPLDAIAGFLRQILIALPQYYEVDGWDSYIGDQIARYESSVWRGVSVGGSLVGAVILGVMIGFGVWSLFRNREAKTSTRWLVGVWALVVTVATLVLTPIEWQRYYLPVYPAAGLLAASGLAWLVRKFGRSDTSPLPKV